MIEVEKKFQPTEEQLEMLLQNAEFLGEKINHDIYYDYEDLRLFYNDLKLRNRNGSFELKIGKKIGEGELERISEEIEDEKEIRKYFKTDLSMQDFVDQHMTVFTDYVNNRKKYKKDSFTIDVDNMDFGYELCEVELLVEDEIKAHEASNLIVHFLEQYGIQIQKIPSKREVYMRLKKPDLHQRIYGN